MGERSEPEIFLELWIRCRWQVKQVIFYFWDEKVGIVGGFEEKVGKNRIKIKK